jgi:hypothetical protein
MHLIGQVAWKDLGAGNPKDENFAWSTSTSPLKYEVMWLGLVSDEIFFYEKLVYTSFFT